MVKKTVTTEVFVANDGTIFTDEYECMEHEQFLKNKQGTHLYRLDLNGNWHPTPYESGDVDAIIFDTFEAYQQYIDEFGDLDDRACPDSQFPIMFRYDTENHCCKDWRKEREQLKKLLARYDEIFKLKYRGLISDQSR